MLKLSGKEALLIDPNNILAKLNQLVVAQGQEKIPEVKKVLCYDPACYDFTDDLLQQICDQYWQIIELGLLPTVKNFLRYRSEVNIVISTCPDHIQIAKHKDKRISTCVHYISFRYHGVYWYKPKYNVAVLLPKSKSDLAVMLKTKSTYLTDILADGLSLLNWEQENFTDNIIKAFAL